MRRRLALAALLLLPTCGGSPSALSQGGEVGPAGAPALGVIPRIAVIVMENREYDSVIGSSDAPFVNSLAQRYGLASQAFAITHPSLPNYLALLGGSTLGITSDCTDCGVDAPSLVDQLQRAGISWRAYMESMPSACFEGAESGLYAKKHNPFAYFEGIAGDPERCANVVPLTRLDPDLRSHRPPRFIWISPNLCNDGHDCSTATADGWLAREVPPLLEALGSHGLLFLTWDEGKSDAGCCASTAGGGHIATVVAGPGARRGATLADPTDHYSILKTIEELDGLPALGGAACPCTTDLMRLVSVPDAK